MNFLLVALGLLAICVLIIALLARARESGDIRRLPGPSASVSSWIWGHELLVFQHAATQMHCIWARSFGGLFKIKAALFHPDIGSLNITIIVATDHSAVHHIFANSDIYVKSPAFRPPIKNLLGEGVLWAEGDDWRQQRKMLSHVFSTESVREMTPAIYECAERLEARLINLILLDCATAKNGTWFNIVPFLSACTLDTIGAVALSHSFSAQSTDSTALRNDLHSDAAQISASWANHVNVGLKPFAFLAPIVVRAIPASQGVVKTIVRRIGRKILEREQPAFDQNNLTGSEKSKDYPSQGKDIISILLRGLKVGKASHEKLSDEQILANVRGSCVLRMVGHETTAGSLAFILWELARQPAIQDRLRTEVLSSGRDLSYDRIQKLEFLDAVIKEGLRLHPPSPQTERVALQDDTIPLSNSLPGIGPTFHVKRGQVISIPFTPMHTNPKVWGPSAAVFDPARWLEHRDPASLPHGWSGLLSFCDGPRNCLGWRLALLELKIMLVTLVRSIVFTDSGVHVEEKISPTLQPVVDGRGGNLPLCLKLI
ncbi:cytochrome P450 [Mycena galopus ATCC 62051]|nr:cytochrome P450 [Mycena galopus ATCC 62051]